MKTEKTYDVFMACGCGYIGVSEKADIGTRLAVCSNDGKIKMVPQNENGEAAPCIFCQITKRAKRKVDIFYSEADRMRGSRPTGKLVTCVVCHTADHTSPKEE